jgi:hypothetical protein
MGQMRHMGHLRGTGNGDWSDEADSHASDVSKGKRSRNAKRVTPDGYPLEPRTPKS